MKTQKIKNTVKVTQNSYKDEGEGVISFPNGLTISDDQVQRNGSRYDIESLDITKYAGQLTADHKDELRNIIGRVEGVKKANGPQRCPVQQYKTKGEKLWNNSTHHTTTSNVKTTAHSHELTA